MKKWQKKTTMILAALLICAVLGGCGSAAGTNGAEDATEEAKVSSVTSAQTPEPEETEGEWITQEDNPADTTKVEGELLEEPEQEEPKPADTDLPMLTIEGNFMPARSIDGIDVMNDKVVALTFDDGPHPERTGQLLDILEQNGVVATFFVLGKNAESYPDVVKRVYEAGHEIGTHSYDHTDLMTLTYDQVITEQYGKTNDILEGIIGVRALIDRPPYGSMSPERAEEIGRAQILWSVDPNEWREEFKNTESLVNNVLHGSEKTGLGVHDGAVVLSHDIHQVTVDAYDTIIKELKNQGYTFVTVTQMMQIAEMRGKTEGFYKFNSAPTAEKAAELLGDSGNEVAAGGEADTGDVE
ncbi:polysaccharide deacetylase family protein [Christensenellaceae bacterium OttesenSCG-928-K19]|nr:polysaccharide deacetylase family protein [Christensenellaceae bacterium OttesenSCG-928-K19]